MKYKYHKIIWDLILKRVTLTEIREAQNIDDIVTKLRKLKRVNVNQLLSLTYERVEAAVEIYNRYTTRKQIHILEWAPVLIALYKKIMMNYGGQLAFINVFVTGITNKKIAATLYKAAEAFIAVAKKRQDAKGTPND